jgi:serine/threonine-protein kinase
MLAVLLIFGLPGLLAYKALQLRHERKMKELEARTGGSAELGELRAERALLMERVENLESIVCSVDHELNQKLNRLVLDVSRMPALPAAAGADSDKNPDSNRNKNTDNAGDRDPDRQAADKLAMTATDYSPGHRRAAAASYELEIGALLGGRYRILRLLGRGGMGAVYLADDHALGESVALKVVSSSLALEPEQAINRFRREAQAARRIAHPNVIRIHDLGESGALLYISMEYFAGRTLSDVLETRGKLVGDALRDIVGQICKGLEAAHAAGVVHRDLKPGNVLVGERDAVKLIDFGLATSELMKGLTATGQMLGTPHYMSPEQIRGMPVDVRSDVYSLAALTFRAATGEPPFDGASPIAVGFAHLMEPVPNSKKLNPEISDKLCSAISRGLAKDPSKRPQSVAEFHKALLA